MMARWYEPVVEKCAQLGISFIAFSPLANGSLSGQYQKTQFTEKTDFRSNMPPFQEGVHEIINALFDKLKVIAQKHNCTLPQLSLAWMCALYDNLIPIPGSTKTYRMKENLEAETINLSPEDLAEINALLDAAGELPVYGGRPVSA